MKYEILDTLPPTQNVCKMVKSIKKCGNPATFNII